jgi:two-component system response regulator HydG
MDTLYRPSLLGIAERLEDFSEPAVLLSPDYRILAVNTAFEAVFGTLDARKRLHCYEFAHGYRAPCHKAGKDCPLKSSLETGQSQRRVHVHKTLSGEQHVDEDTIPVKEEGGEIAYFLQLLRPTARGDRHGQGARRPRRS